MYPLSLSLLPVNRAANFMAAAQQEKRREREALESGLMFTRDRLTEATVVRLTTHAHILCLIKVVTLTSR